MNNLLKKAEIKASAAEVLAVAIPLIISTSAHTVRTFTDRVFLMRYEPQAMSGAMFAGLCFFCICAFFLGIVSYVSTFVAQYNGSGRHYRIGQSVWQGVYLAIFFGIIGSFAYFLAEPLFRWMGHSSETLRYEVIYFRIMCVSFIPVLVGQAFACFHIGRGKTKTVMYVNILTCAVNIILDYILIFGNFGAPELGIHGAGYATVASIAAGTLVYAGSFIRKKNQSRYGAVSGYPFLWPLTKRILRYGLPNGVNFMLDIAAFTSFLGFVGRYGEDIHTAASLVFSVNMIAFMPVIGLGMAVSVITGKYLGMNKPGLAVRNAWIAYSMALAYFICTGLMYVFAGKVLITPFTGEMAEGQVNALMSLAYPLMCFIAAFSIADAGAIIFSNVLKGAGDTRFVMTITITLSWLLMVLPSYVSVKLSLPYFVPWIGLTVYIYMLNFAFLVRFLKGRWKKMRVIEMEAVEDIGDKCELPPAKI
ncbi:MATE family efflux transporter [Sedimentisphaera salicampi]|uniref:Multidrug-efflux transporter n=1 Tax=Sedimentisphaera salicampi TaxID=1941349 RepID=A0A1W6LQ46_9BACT|nr:MATE family efflux transporter [Sedimentisphaera salicampi]ARN57899.1 Na(+)/drug antiporter [Sedimentisphaera salicampi]